MKNEIIQNLIESWNIIKEIVQEDSAIVISDNEKFLFVKEGKNIKLPMKTGESIGKMNDKQGIVEKAIREKQTNYMIRHIEEFDTYTYNATIPIIDNKNVIGIFSFIKDATIQEKNKCTSTELINKISDIHISVNIIKESAEKITKFLTDLIGVSMNLEKTIDESSNTLHLISAVSKKTNILGINANIESSRAGENGRGFNVVAKEIMKLAVQSSEMTNKIKDSLYDMKKSVETNLSVMKNFNELIKSQEESTKEIAESINIVLNISKKLNL